MTQPHLLTRRPSPTTVEYTVSTSPILTFPLRLLFLIVSILRIQTGLSILLLLYSKYLLSTFASPAEAYDTTPPIVISADYLSHLLHSITQSALSTLFSRFAACIPVTILLPTVTLVSYAIFLRPYTTESLLVLRGLGIQTSSSSETYLSTATTRFIPTEKIQDIFVNEAFRGFEVRYYLVVVVEGEEEVVICFPRLLPRRAIVETVWRGVRGCLFEPPMEGGVGHGKS